MHKTLMIQGATSDAGKSLVVTALCRILARRGLRVAPFKPQNMALNSAVTLDGGEIGRAQAVQARAAGLEPHTDMNPVLLKPCSDVGAQVIIHGKARFNLGAREYQDYKQTAMAAVLESYQRLRSQYDYIIVEGAGSPAEINLRQNDIANMGFAEAVDCPVVLVADIDRGGVFAHFVGTLDLLSESEQRRVRGFLINKFRGDLVLLQPGNDWLEQRTGKPVLGVIPYLQNLYLEAEDALPRAHPANAGALKVIVPALPRISNHTDFDPLRLNPQVEFQFIGPGQPIPPADLVILPGSKSVRNDLAWLRLQGWPEYLQRHLRYGGKLLGICGGYQMLGQSIQDPHGLESTAGSSAGLGLLPVVTRLEAEKQLRHVTGRLFGGLFSGTTLSETLFSGTRVSGYEIHCGVTSHTSTVQPLIHLDHGPDGAISEDGQVAGTYLHGLFDQPPAAADILQWAGLKSAHGIDMDALIERDLDRLADSVEATMDWDRLKLFK